VRGRKPVPTHLKILRGNPGGRPINRNEPKPQPRRPSCPAWLSPEAKKAWRFLVRELEDMGVLAKIQGPVLVVLSEAIAHHQEACRIVDAAGVLIKGRDGGLVKNPACQIARDTGAAIGRLGGEFGMTPSMLTRLSLPTESDDELTRRYLT
jgi:P27 family predicted phage terminase small subunit